MHRRKFIQTASGLLVPALACGVAPAIVRSSVPIPIGFWKPPAAAGASYDPNYPLSILTVGAWWKADSFSGLADADPIGGTGKEWVDSSGSGHTLTQTNATFRPTYRTGVMNGLPIIRFATQYLDLASWTITDNPSSLCIVLVGTCNSVASYVLTKTASGWPQFLNEGASNKLTIWDGTTYSQSDVFSSAPTTPRMMTWQVASSPYYENATSRGNSTAGGGLNYTVHVFGGYLVTPAYYNGDIAECIVWQRALSSTEIGNLYTLYCKPKWGLA